MGTLYAAPRIFYAQARAGHLPRWLGAVHPRMRTPVPAILAVWAASVGLVLLDALGPRYDYYTFYSLQLVFAWMVSWLLTLTAAVLYRRRLPDEVRALPWRQPLYPLFPLLGLIGIVVVTYYTFRSQPLTLAVGGGWVALAAGYYLLFAGRRVGRTPLT
jgi:APA family basic amino acid/polyamine antiporter/D-serine/D-alanine/glycine transporter/ethanolamine permease